MSTWRPGFRRTIHREASNSGTTLFPTTVVGSMPRPVFVQELLEPQSLAKLGPEVWQSRMDSAVRYMLAMMDATGIDIITDGEWRRRSYTERPTPTAK